MNRVKELRQRAGMQQKEIAMALGVSRPTVSEWEHQKKDPSGDRLKKLASLFDVSPGVILCLYPVDDEISTKEVQIDTIDFALSGEIRDLTDAEKQDVLDYVRFKRAQKARQEAKQ